MSEQPSIGPRCRCLHAAIVVTLLLLTVCVVAAPLATAQDGVDSDGDGVPDADDCNPSDPATGSCDDGNVCTIDVCNPATRACVQNSVAAGGLHSCAVRTDGRLACWGSNSHGQVSGPNSSTDAYTAVSGGFFHTCAVRVDGRLACWGHNGYGQVSFPNASTDSYAAVSAGFYHTCALRADGRLVCWGFDEHGQVSGPNGSTDTYDSVSSGFAHTCAVRTNGRLACWGDDAYGQVYVPSQSTDSYSTIGAGQYHTCALRTDRRLVCWGSSSAWEVWGPNESTDSYTAVSAGTMLTCAIGTSGRLACWGFDDDGQVSGPNGSTASYFAVDAGIYHTCAVRADGRLACWGGSYYGEVSGPNSSTGVYGTGELNCDDGNPCTTDSCDSVQGCLHVAGNAGGICRAAAGPCDLPERCTGSDATCPADVATPAGTPCRAAAGACDLAESCDGLDPHCPADLFLPSATVCRPATEQCDGTVEQCTGTDPLCPPNEHNVPDGTLCDDGNACTVNESCRVGLCLPLAQQSAISAGGSHSCALLTDGRIACWGSDAFGQIAGPNASIDNYTAVSAGGSHTCALRVDGRLVCWGSNVFGESSGPNGSNDSFTAVSSGDAHTCALRIDGRLACWGSDSNGSVSGPNASSAGYTALSAGYRHTCALRADGRLACWGDNGAGKVSGPNASTDSYAAVSAGGAHTCALRTNGRLACWGNNDYAQVAGPNASSDQYAAVSAGNSHTCASGVDGHLECWGLEYRCWTWDDGSDDGDDCEVGCPSSPDSSYCENDDRVSGPNGSTGVFTGVAAGSSSTCALRSDGRLACWGSQTTSCWMASDCGGCTGPYWRWECSTDDRVSGPNASPHFYGLGQLDCDDGNPCTVEACDAVQGCVHTPGNAEAVCRPIVSACDLEAETCTGSEAACPADTFAPERAACRPAAGPCDLPESCDGVTSRCPPDVLLPSTSVCRPSSGQCGDEAESCTGTDPLCPANQQNVSDGTVCNDGNACTVSDGCTRGSCISRAAGTAVGAFAGKTCALRVDGSLACWGLDWYGEISSPNGSADGYLAVDVGGDRTCAVRADGHLACWGGDGGYGGTGIPPTDWPGGWTSGPNASTASYTAVSAGGTFHTCALRTDARIECWGSDQVGYFGARSNQVSGPNATSFYYSAVSAAGYQTCALRLDGRLACWGYDDYGQVSGPNETAEIFNAVSTGGSHTCAVRTDRRIVCWGNDDDGQVSGPNANLETYTVVSTAESHTCALRTDGRIACWGSDAFGQIAGPNASIDGYTAVSAGSSHTCALRTDRSLICWGSDDYGEVSGPNLATQLDTLNRLDCTDANACTDDSCNPTIGCVHTVPAWAACDDGSNCTFDSCDPGTGACSHANHPDGTSCTDGNLCTTGDACQAGVCTPTVSGLDEPNPRTNGYYKRLCRGPHSGDQLTDADAACVAQLTATFAGISTVAQICEEIEPSHPNNDKCDQTEDDLMVLALNICRARVCTAQSIASRCGSNENVGQSLAESDAILGSTSRTFEACSHAKCLDEEINTGGALELNTLTLSLDAGNVRLNWERPYLNDGTDLLGGYQVWRRAQGSLSPFTRIGETTSPSFLDTTSGISDWEYEITIVMD